MVAGELEAVSSMSDSEHWLSHGFRRASGLLETQAALGWAVIVALLALLGVVYLARGSQMIMTGYHMKELTDELRALQEENVVLDARIASVRSLDELRDKARAMGFTLAGPSDIEYLLVDDYPAAPGPVKEAPIPATPEIATGLASWWAGLMRGFGGWTHSMAGEGF